jgi:hypothetical protein
LTAEGSGLEDGGGGLLDVLLGRNTDHEGGNVNQLLSNSNVSLTDKNASMVNAVGDLSLHDESLESAFQELANGKTKNVIELSLIVLEETKTDHAADKSLA